MARSSCISPLSGCSATGSTSTSGRGYFFGYGVIVTVAWVTWLRAVEFHRAFPGAEDQMQVRSDGPARLRRGE